MTKPGRSPMLEDSRRPFHGRDCGLLRVRMPPTVHLRWEVVNVLERTGWELGETARDVLEGETLRSRVTQL